MEVVALVEPNTFEYNGAHWLKTGGKKPYRGTAMGNPPFHDPLPSEGVNRRLVLVPFRWNGVSP